MGLDWNKVQSTWQKKWADVGLGRASVSGNKEKFFMIFAYPGVSGFLHVGHMRGFSYTDAICRYQRLKGKEVLFPVGTHASGNQAIAFANKVKSNDKDWIEYLRRNGCPEATIQKLTTPKAVIDYFNTVYVEEYWKKFGFLCDWERFTCTTFADYEKFIQWQFAKLKEKDLLIQKPYFATACIVHGPVAVDPSETDISKGGNAEKNEYTLLKFKFGEDYLVAATLRPETIFGQTNLWVNPKAHYVRVQVSGEKWIMSAQAAEKLKYQKDDVILGEEIDPLDLIGRSALAPGIQKEIIILPAPFCDPTIGSGIVTCVPSDAPYDFVALRRLQKNSEECEKFGLDPEHVAAIPLIPIIRSKGYGDYPAKEIIEKLEITELDDPNLDYATKEIYKAGFHTGVMRDNCGKYAGMKVAQAKEVMRADLLERGDADTFYDLSEEVVCRCGEPVVVKRIDDQWFIKYSDSELTERSKEQSKEMHIYPKEFQENLPGILDWFSDRACARLGNWLGSKFPFDDKWTVEPISDSTLYPAYYIVSKFVNSKKIKHKDLTSEFFDYVFLGKGEGRKEWEAVRAEFEYFYPLDLNLGGKEHKTVHFPVFLMNHVAILPEEKWPRGILVNWWVTGKGSKISKSKGGAEPIPAAIEKYGVDAMRLYYAHIGSPHVDVVWTEETVLGYKNALERVYSIVQELLGLKGPASSIDKWLLSKTYQLVKDVDRAMEKYDLREMASLVYYSYYDDLRWYVRRGGGNPEVISVVIGIWSKLLNPITPHLSEEINSTEIVSVSSWPAEGHVSAAAEASEELVKETIEGMRNVLKLAKVEKPRKFVLFVSQKWLYKLFSIVSAEIKVTRNMGEIMRKCLEDESLKEHGKHISKIVASLLKDVSKLPHVVTSQKDELNTMYSAQEFLEKEFGCAIEIVNGDESDLPKAKGATPGKVGILVE